MKDAFYVIKMSKDSYHLLGFRWKGLYYFYKTLPMGLSISCQIFERLSCAVQWILLNKLNVAHMSHILDDFMFFGKAGTRDCEIGLQSFLHLSESLGLPIKHEKTVLPTTKAVLHGVLFDTEKMITGFPQILW